MSVVKTTLMNIKINTQSERSQTQKTAITFIWNPIEGKTTWQKREWLLGVGVGEDVAKLDVEVNRRNWKLPRKKGKFCSLIIMVHACQAACCVWLSGTLWTIVHQAPLFMGFSRQEYWSGLQYPPLGDLPEAGFKPASLMSLSLAGIFFTTSTIWEAQSSWCAQVAQSCPWPTLCSPIDCSPPGFSVHGVFQARILGLVAISYCRWSSKGLNVKLLCLLHWQVESLPLELSGKPTFSLLDIYPDKTIIQEVHKSLYSEQHYSQYPRYGNKLNVHWQMNG